jgi:xanthine dehydrogenase accessory factor
MQDGCLFASTTKNVQMDNDQKAIYEAVMQGEPLAVVTVISTQGSMPRHAGSKMVVRPDGSIIGTVGGGTMEARVIQEALEAMQDGQTRLKSYTLNSLEAGDAGVCGGTAQLFIEPVNLMPTLLVIGGGHCGKALAELGKWMGYRVVLSDDREAFCNPDEVPDLDEYIVCKPAEIPDHIRIDTHTYIAAVTRGIPVDIELIPALLKTPAPYIGVIGSSRRWALTEKALREQYALDDTVLSRIRAPIGLELEAETPKEIALSIMAEIVMVRRGGTGVSMGDKTATKG